MIRLKRSLLQKFVDIWEFSNRETALRSLIKAYTYRFCSTLATITIAWIVTGEILMSVAIGASELVIKPLIYWFHERFWNRINWGINFYK